MKYALYGGAGIAVTLIVFTIIRSFIDPSQLIEGFTLARTTATLGSRTNTNLLNTQETTKQGVIITRDLCVELVFLATNLQSESLKQAFEVVNVRLAALDHGMVEITNLLNNNKTL